MPDLNTTFMGIPLKNPIIVGSSTLTDTPEKIQELEKQGAAAVVLKSLFEQEVRNMNNSAKCCNFHPEAYYYDISDAGMLYGISDYLRLIKEAKQAASIPVIASICCENAEWWSSYPERIAKAGADAIELNINMLSLNTKKAPSEIYNDTLHIIETVKKSTDIPFSVKLSPYCCSIPYLVKMLKQAGVYGVTLFSRLFEMGINLTEFECEPASYYSSPVETYKVLRWINVVTEQVDMEICGSTGVHSAAEAIQHILAGAGAVQMVSALYQNGAEVISQTLEGIEKYMYDKQFQNINELKGFLRTKHKDFDLVYFNSLTHDRFQLDSHMG